MRTGYDSNSKTFTSWSKFIHSSNYTDYVNTTNFPGLNKVGTVTSVTVTGANGLSGTGTITSSGTITLSNAGVRSTIINGNYLRVNTNGTNTDLTIPYATNADTVDGYHFSDLESRYVNVTGDTMSGKLNIGIESSGNANPLCLYHSNIAGSKVKGKSVGIRLGHDANSYYARIAAIFESQNPDYLRPGLAFYTMDSTYQENTESERMRISAAGNVGIGTATPGYKLDVNGTANATELYENRVRVSVRGHTHTKSQITDFPSSLPANGGNADYASSAGNADTVDNYHASNLTKFYLSPMSSDAPADSAKSWFINTMPSASGAIVYNVPGSEKTIIAGKSSGAYGHMLQLNYDDNYLRILRYYGGSWKTTDWEKISAGYADSAGSIAWGNITGKPSTFTPSSHSHNYLPLSGGTCTGNIYAPAFYESSDERLKDFYNSIDVDLDKLSSLPKKFFKWKSNPNGEFEIGTSAQELQKIYPQLVNTDDKGYLTVAYDKLSIIALRAIDKLYEMNKNLERRIQILESKR